MCLLDCVFCIHMCALGEWGGHTGVCISRVYKALKAAPGLAVSICSYTDKSKTHWLNPGAKLSTHTHTYTHSLRESGSSLTFSSLCMMLQTITEKQPSMQYQHIATLISVLQPHCFLRTVWWISDVKWCTISGGWGRGWLWNTFHKTLSKQRVTLFLVLTWFM